jgi:D-xylulose reductase
VKLTDGWGADVVFEASGSPKAWQTLLALPRPGGCVVVVGLPIEPTSIDWALASTKEIRFETVFRYAHQYPRAIQMLGSGKVDLTRLVSATFPFEQSIVAFERAAAARPGDIKLQIEVT